MRRMKLKYTGNVILLERFKHWGHLGNLDVDRGQNVVKGSMMCGCELNLVGLM